ncbi:MAG: hypothetical protein ACRDI2_26395 [Chloroflexota bacterium]
MNETLILQPLTDADVALICAQAQLRRAQAAALLGIHYNPDQLDRLILAHRAARREAERARQTWQPLRQHPAIRRAGSTPAPTFAPAA